MSWSLELVDSQVLLFLLALLDFHLVQVDFAFAELALDFSLIGKFCVFAAKVRESLGHDIRDLVQSEVIGEVVKEARLAFSVRRTAQSMAWRDLAQRAEFAIRAKFTTTSALARTLIAVATVVTILAIVAWSRFS